MPPLRTSRSAATPSAGLAVMAENPSEPPHCSPRIRWRAGTFWRLTALAAGSISLILAMPASTVLRVPPVSWMTRVWIREPTSSSSATTSAESWLDSQPRPMISTPAKLGCLA